MVATGGLGGLLVLAGLVSGMWLRGATARPAGRLHPKSSAVVPEMLEIADYERPRAKPPAPTTGRR